MVKLNLACLLLCTMFFSSVGMAFADDLEIFGGTTGGVPPNVLIIFDNSSSMVLNEVSDGNWRTSDPTRLAVAKDAVKGLVSDPDNQDVRFGLMVFNSSKEGGYLLQPSLSRTENSVLISAIDDDINPPNRSPYTFTPLAETLVEAGLYFAGEPSWFNDNVTYTSPVQYSCQKNYIILMTDGEPTYDNDSLLATKAYIDNSSNPIGDADNDGCDPNGCSSPGVQSSSNLYNSYNGDGSAGYGSDYLDDVAYYLFHNNCKTSLTSLGDEYKTKFIRTNTIGFATDQALLEDAATNGGGNYYTASNASELTSRFEEILSDVNSAANATYAPLVIPRNPENQIQTGNKVYMAFFKPQTDGRWIGNLKAYSLLNGELHDMNGVSATYPADPSATGYVADKEGYIKPTAQSYWSSAADGLEVGKGGAGEVLNSNASRNVYTFTSVDPSANFIDTSNNDNDRKLIHQSNEFKTTTNNSLETLLTSIYGASPTPDEIVNLTLGGTTVSYDDGSTANWTLGDIIHSEPLVYSFDQDCNGDSSDNPDDYVFVGANDGMLHVFCAEDGGEEWAFVPPKQLERLHLLDNGSHNYFVDGSPVIEALFDGTSTVKLLLFGEGRGGERYYALDVTDPADPYWKYQVNEQKLQNTDGDGDGSLDGAEAVLGQSWAKPQLKRVRYQDNSVETFADVFLFAGGYDTRYETNTFPATTPQSPEISGRAIYTIDAFSGAPVGLNINGGNWSEMQHSILDVTAFDTVDVGYINRAYAGDLGGKIFGAKYDVARYSWEKLALLDLPASSDYVDSDGVTQSYNLGQKFMNKPDATIEYDGECLYLGSGDREHLTNTDKVDAFYSLCNRWVKQVDVDGNDIVDTNGDFVYEPLAFDDLADVTDNILQDGDVNDAADVAQITQVRNKLNSGHGWFIRMEHDGEKITSSPKVIDGKVFFTTYTPGTDVAGLADPCNTSFDLGVSRLYALDYRTGEAVMNLDGSTDPQLNKDDRSVTIGTSVASDPVLTTIGSKTTLATGAGGKLLLMDVDTGAVLRRYYWRQVK